MADDRERRKGRRAPLWAAYDGLWLVFASLVYGLSLVPPAALLRGVHSRWGWVATLFAVLPAYVLFVLGLALLLAALRLVSPRVAPGTYEKFAGGAYFALIWRAGLMSLIQTTPMIRTVNFLAVLRYVYYRGQGMRTHFENWFGTDAFIADPSLVSLGRGVSLGDLSALSCHLALPDQMLVAPIVLGDGVMVGGAAKIGPGVTVGAHALIGADAALGPRVTVGEGAYVEPFSKVSPHTVIGPYERWGGNPAVKVGTRERPGA